MIIVLKKLGLVGVALGVIVTASGWFLPSKTVVVRSITIQAPVQTVVYLVGHLPEHEKWSPWKAFDPTVKNTYSNPSHGVGASMTWRGEKIKTGSMTITDMREPQLIVAELDFGANGKAQSAWTFQPSDNGVNVTWSYEADNGNNPLKRYVALFFIKRKIADAFDLGLTNLKHVSEQVAESQQSETYHIPDMIPTHFGVSN
ncbi:hypothetical protein EB093_07120 [bacterium]|nr:hypothetical protein [bacterium]